MVALSSLSLALSLSAKSLERLLRYWRLSQLCSVAHDYNSGIVGKPVPGD